MVTDDGILEILQAAVLTGKNFFTQSRVAYQPVNSQSGAHRVVVRQQNAGTVQRIRNGRRRPRNNGDAETHRFCQRYTETFMLAHAEKNISQLVVRKDLIEFYMAGEYDVFDAEQVDVVMQALGIAVDIAAADQKKTAFGIEMFFIPGKSTDHIFLVFMGRNAAHKNQVGPIVVVKIQNGLAGRLLVIFKGDKDRAYINRAGKPGFEQVLLVIL